MSRTNPHRVRRARKSNGLISASQPLSAASPSWSAYDIRAKLQAYFERGFASTQTQRNRLKALLGTNRARIRRMPKNWRKYMGYADQSAFTGGPHTSIHLIITPWRPRSLPAVPDAARLRASGARGPGKPGTLR